MEFVYEETVLIEIYLDEERTEGKHWVAFDAGVSRLGKDDLTCFTAIYDAKQYCFDNSVGDEQYTFCTIDKMQQALDSTIKKVFKKSRK